MSKILGWNPGNYDCADINGDTLINIFDITDLISFLYIEGSLFPQGAVLRCCVSW